MTRPGKILLFVAALLLAATEGQGETVELKTYHAPTTARVLEIDPQNRDGSGEADYRMCIGKLDVWHARLPFTLCEAAVTDSGVVAGFGYSHGLRASGVGRPGTLDVVILDAAGGTRLYEGIKRQQSRFPDGQPEPMARGILIHPAEDLFTLRLHSDTGEEWRTYRLSTGEKLRSFDLRTASGAPQTAAFVMKPRELAGRPLTLVDWWLYDGRNSQCGVFFALCNLEGKVVWSMELPADYMVPGHGAAERKLQANIRESGAVLDALETGVFELRLVAAGERVRFEVEADASMPGGWRVTEAGRSKYQAPPAAVAWTGPEDRPPLRRLGSFVLQDKTLEGPVHDISTFAFDGEGHAGFLRAADGEGANARAKTFVLVDGTGKALVETALPPDADETLELAWLQGSRWIVATTTNGKRSRAWWLDAAKGGMTEVTGFNCPTVERILRVPDGGFVVLGRAIKKNSGRSELIRFDAAGKQLWKLRSRNDDKPSSMISPEGLVVTGGKEIALLDLSDATVRFFGMNGGWVRTVKLAEAWGRRPNYPSSLMPDTDGGLIVYDFRGSPSYVRMGLDDKVRGGFDPHYAGGHLIEVRNDLLRPAPDGHLWSCDGHCLARLSEAGEAEHFIGPPPDADHLVCIAALAGDQQGHVYAVDGRARAVHVFDAHGAKVRVCKPEPADVRARPVFSTPVTAADDGSVFLAQGGETPREICFDPGGRRTALEELDIDFVAQEWHAQTGTTNLLVLGYEKAFIISRAGKVLRTIERLPDRRWLGLMKGAAVAPDGSFAILSERGDESIRSNHLSFFTSKGEAVDAFELQQGYLELRGFNGTHVSLANAEGVVVRDRKGAVVNRIPRPRNRGWDHFVTRGGYELRIVDFTTRKVDRYVMPGHGEETP